MFALTLISLVAASSSSSREKPVREEAVQEAHSPSSQHQRLGQQTKQANGSRSEYKVASRSSDNDSPLPSQSLKSDLEDGPANAGPHKADEQGDGAALANGTVGAASRCVNGIFAGHGKLKRLLGTLVQFATDISADTGDTVRTLVLALLVSKLARGSARSAPWSKVRRFRMSPRGNNNVPFAVRLVFRSS